MELLPYCELLHPFLPFLYANHECSLPEKPKVAWIPLLQAGQTTSSIYRRCTLSGIDGCFSRPKRLRSEDQTCLFPPSLVESDFGKIAPSRGGTFQLHSTPCLCYFLKGSFPVLLCPCKISSSKNQKESRG